MIELSQSNIITSTEDHIHGKSLDAHQKSVWIDKKRRN